VNKAKQCTHNREQCRVRSHCPQPLIKATNNNHTNCVEMIARTIDRPSLGASTNNDGWKATHRAADGGHTQSLFNLFKCGAPMQTPQLHRYPQCQSSLCDMTSVFFGRVGDEPTARHTSTINLETGPRTSDCGKQRQMDETTTATANQRGRRASRT
jgi:hypothetical protein